MFREEKHYLVAVLKKAIKRASERKEK